MPPSTTKAPDAGRPGTARAEALSDGVFAITVTLLVFTLHEPSVADVAQHGGLVAVLLAGWPSYVAYLATFVTIGVTWLNHHAFFVKVARMDPTLQWWNLVLLLAVSFAPFPTSLAATFLSDDLSGASARAATVLFMLVSMLRPLVWVFLWGHLRSHPDLLEPGYGGDHARSEQVRCGVGCVFYAVGAGVAALVPIAAVVLAILIAVFYALTARGADRVSSGAGGG